MNTHHQDTSEERSRSIRDAFDRDVARQRAELERGRRESDPCDRGTPGCSVIRHTDLDSECEPW
jgi:hypothetical protein